MHEVNEEADTFNRSLVEWQYGSPLRQASSRLCLRMCWWWFYLISLPQEQCSDTNSPCKLSVSTGSSRGLAVGRVCCYGDAVQPPESSAHFLPSFLPSHLSSSRTAIHTRGSCAWQMRQQACTEIWEGPPGEKEELLHEDSLALEQGVQGHCAVTASGGFQAWFM